ncbi:MAG: hypothetical protein ACYCSN_00105 [Acidobacteriaceae bacterium]
MADRTSRLWVAILITVMDVTVFERFFTITWLALSSVLWTRVVLSLMLTAWTGSAAVIWLHVYYDVRHLLYERRPAAALGHANSKVPSDQGGPINV